MSVQYDKDAYIILNGDILNNATKTSVSDCYSEVLMPMEQIQQAVELFVQIRVGKETDIYVTDKYHSISLFFDDGEKVVFSLNGDSLEYRKNGKTELYQLENIEQFWKEVKI